jgi:hypothetical protein
MNSYVAIPRRIEKAKASLDQIEALAASYEPTVAKAILKALQDQSDGLDLDKLAEALARGNLGAVLDMLSLQLGGLGDALQDVVWAGGALAASNIAVGGTVFHFHRLNPVLIDWLQNYTLGLIREINDNTKSAIRNQLVEGMRLGKGPRAQARHIKVVVGLTDRQAKAVANFRKELEGFHNKRTAGAWKLGAKIDRVNQAQVFKPDADGLPKDGILARRLRDFRYDGQLARAMADKKPLTPAQIDKMVAAYGRKYRKYRAETIARTESMRALNIGVQEGWRQAVMEGKVVEDLIRRFWKVARDERLCQICSPIPGLNKQGAKLGVPFATPDGPRMLPPVHPDCRCHVFIRQLEPEQLTG